MGDIPSIALDEGNIAHFLPIILIVAPLGAMLVPITGTLLFFTHPEARKRPVFVLNIVACCLGILQATYIVAFTCQVLLHPEKPLPVASYIVNMILLLLPPLFIDSILLLRLVAFYPVQLASPRTLAKLLAIPMLLKAARLAVLVAFLATYPIDRLRGPRVTSISGLIWGRGTLVIMLFALQAFDNAYASSLFLYKLWRFRKKGKDAGTYNDVLARVPAAFTIALGNYVFPVAMNIVQITLMLTMPHFSNGIYIIFANNFVTILGVVFATIWTSQQNWVLRHLLESGADSRTLSGMQFRVKSVTTNSSAYDAEDALDYR